MNSMDIWIKDMETDNVWKYGTDQHDSLKVSQDGKTIVYYNLQNGESSNYGTYVICDENGLTPEEYIAETGNYDAEMYANIGGDEDDAAKRKVRNEKWKEEWDQMKGD